MPRCSDVPLLVMGLSVFPVVISHLAVVLREASPSSVHALTELLVWGVLLPVASSPWSATRFASIFSGSAVCIFLLVTNKSSGQFIQLSCAWLVLLTSSQRTACLVLDPEDCPPLRKCCFPESLIVSYFTLASLIHFEYISV